jgi:SprT protein
MAATEHPMEALKAYIPEGSFDKVVQYIHRYKVHLTVTRQRKTILGDYRHAYASQHHRITVNGNLNKYEFLITLLHELAHLLTFDAFGNRVEAHGKEWKNAYSQLLTDFVNTGIFPDDIRQALHKSIMNPAATASGETALLRVLRNYNTQQRTDVVLLEQLPLHALFMTRDGRIFKRGEKLRKRYKCVEVNTNLAYLFSPLYEVKIVTPPADV